MTPDPLDLGASADIDPAADAPYGYWVTYGGDLIPAGPPPRVALRQAEDTIERVRALCAEWTACPWVEWTAGDAAGELLRALDG